MLLVAPLAATPLELHLQHMQTDPKTGEVDQPLQPTADPAGRRECDTIRQYGSVDVC